MLLTKKRRIFHHMKDNFAKTESRENAGFLPVTLLLLMVAAGAVSPVFGAAGSAGPETGASVAGTEVAGNPGGLQAGAKTDRFDAALDPFVATALGLIPFSSGLYLTDEPARGILFTGVDVLTAIGIYTSRYTIAGDPNNAIKYFALMAANNVLDAMISLRYARLANTTALILPGPDGGLTANLYVRF